MNYLTLFMLSIVLFFSQSVAQAPGPIIPGYPCPPEDVAGGCRGAKECLYPNPNNCNAFIQCNDAGIAYDMPCAPGGLEWNDAIKECDWPENANCSPSPTNSNPYFNRKLIPPFQPLYSYGPITYGRKF